MEEVLKEHREEEELAKTQGYPQLPPTNMSTNGAPGCPTRPDYQTTDSYGSIAASSVLATSSVLAASAVLVAPSKVVVYDQSQNIARPAYEQENGATGDDDEEAPLFEYKRRQKTSPHLGKPMGPYQCHCSITAFIFR